MQKNFDDNGNAKVSNYLKVIGDFGRTSDHCSNIAVCVIDAHGHNMNIHESLNNLRNETLYFNERYAYYKEKYN